MVSSPATSSRYLIGCMTGTSMDAVDAALVRVEGAGLDMRVCCLRGATAPLGALAERLRAMAGGTPFSAQEFAAAARELMAAHEPLVRELTEDCPISAVVVHGQTLFHRPPLSWQLADPTWLSARLGLPVIADLRTADCAWGGQGAPITPLTDWIMLRSSAETRVVLNLGGFCNWTRLPNGGPEVVTGGDACACNQLLDGVARTVLDAPFDQDGAVAAAGTPDATAVADCRALLANPEGRSLGTGDEATAWIQRWCQTLSPSDLARSAVEAVAATIAGTVHACGPVERILCAGGGVHNRALMAALSAAFQPRACRDTDAEGVPAAWREAMAMAVAGALSLDGVALTLPAVTHAQRALPAGVRTFAAD